MSRSDGMTYAPQGRAEPVVAPGEFVFAAAALDHGHIYGMCNGLTEAGADLHIPTATLSVSLPGSMSTFKRPQRLQSLVLDFS